GPRSWPGLHPTLLDAEVAVHHLDQVLGRAQAEHRQPVAWLEAVVRTGDTVEASAEDARRYPASGVPDLEAQRHQTTSIFRREVDADAAAIGAVDRSGRGLDDRGQLPLLAGLGAGGEEAGGSDHCVELGAQLVADVGPELRVDLDHAPVTVGVSVGGRGRDLLELAHQ